MLFQQILCDPAWAYSNRLSGAGRTVFGSGASGKYHTERTEDMALFRVSDVADPEGCQLRMWFTGPFGEDAYRLMRAWGFEPITIEHVLIKVRKGDGLRGDMAEVLAKGLLGAFRDAVRRLPGHYTASNAEFVLLGSRGATQLPVVKMQPSVIVAETLPHSCKPDALHEHVEMCYPNARKLELFARRERAGWTTLGDAIDGRDLRVSLPELAALGIDV
jgi:N6-adenosine-specific RNA methylase IME4